MKQARLANHHAYIRTLPYWDMYEQYQGKPPIHPGHVQELRRRIAEADDDLRRSIDGDWRQCVVRYPEVLNHYYSLVTVNTPKVVSPPQGLIVAPPTFMSQPARPPLERARSTTGASTTKKTRRNSKIGGTGKGDLDMSALQRLLQDTGLGSNPGANSTSGGGMSGFPGLAGLGGHNGRAMMGGHQGQSSMGLPSALQDKSRGVSGMDGLPAGLSSMGLGSLGGGMGGGFGGLNLGSLGGLGGGSKAGRASPAEDMPKRPRGAKRHSKDFMSEGRATAPLPHPPFAPPTQNHWSNGGRFR